MSRRRLYCRRFAHNILPLHPSCPALLQVVQQEAVYTVTVLQCSKAAVQFVSVLHSGFKKVTAVSRRALPEATRIDLETVMRLDMNAAEQNKVWYWLSQGAAISRHGMYLYSLSGERWIVHESGTQY